MSTQGLGPAVSFTHAAAAAASGPTPSPAPAAPAGQSAPFDPPGTCARLRRPNRLTRIRLKKGAKRPELAAGDRCALYEGFTALGHLHRARSARFLNKDIT
jgi:hypothetical protein